MLSKQSLVAFVATIDGDRARRFYGNVLGLPLISDDPFAIVFDANGTTLRIQKVAEVAAHSYTALGWAVSNIAEVADKLHERGVAFERYAGMAQDQRGVWQSPSGAKVAWFKDPDGNTLSLTES
jgi:catechol 2,3-dioxygenase-like lactoylglutathione lyase family enzyme